MSPSNQSLHHRRLHNLLLIQKLLSSRDSSSPFTLVLDSVEQSAKPLVRRFIEGARAAKTSILFISYETLTPPAGVTFFIKARRKDPAFVRREIEKYTSSSKRTLLIIDSLYQLTTTPTLPAFLSSLTSPSTSLLAIYHTDIPLPHPSSPSPHPNPHPNPKPPPSSSTTTHTFYTPPPLSLLRYLATTLLTTHCFAHSLSLKRARDLSNPTPEFGIEEGREGVLVGVGANDKRGCVIEMEYRRKSGRGVGEWFFVPELAEQNNGDGIGEGEGVKGGGEGGSGNGSEGIVLLDDQVLYKGFDGNGDEGGGQGMGVEVEVERGTFELGLSDKQRRDREGVVLPFLDAQKGEGAGGRILYEMGKEDDFDEEEDEI